MLEVVQDVARCRRAASMPRYWVSNIGDHREAIMATLPCLRAAKERRSCSILCVSLWYRRMWRFSGCGHCGGIRCGMAHSSRTSAFTWRLVSYSNHRDLCCFDYYHRGLSVWYISLSSNRPILPILLAMVAAFSTCTIVSQPSD
jgi:hypothetical protein